MGSFNEVCSLTNLPITHGDEIYAIPVHESKNYRSFGDWVPWGGIIECKYDDYGGIEDVVESAFTKFVKDNLNFDFENNRIEAVDPYSSYDNSISVFVPDFKKRIDFSHITPPVVDERFEDLPEKFNLAPLEILGFEVLDNRTLKFGEISGKISKSPDHAVVWYVETTYQEQKRKVQVSDLNSLLGAFYIPGIQETVEKGGKEFKYPAITLKESVFIDFMGKSDVVFMHKDAFDKYFSTVMSEPNKYDMNFNHTKLIKICEDLKKSSTLSADEAEILDSLSKDQIKAFNNVREEYRDAIINMLKYDFNQVASIASIVPENLAQYFPENLESFDKLNALYSAFMCHGKTFAPMGNTFQWANLDMNEILINVTQDQFEKIKLNSEEDENE